MNILFTCAGRRNYLIDYFSEVLMGNGLTVAADMNISAPAMAVADKSIVVPSVDSPDYVTKILDICRSEGIDAVISLNDLELPILAEERERFVQMGVKLIISSKEIIDICADKWKTNQYARDNNMLTPVTYTSLDLAMEAIENNELTFPLVVKPRWGSASIGLDFVENQEELELSYRLLKFRLSRTILGKVSQQDIDHAILIQEGIVGKEYGLDVLNDFDGNPAQVYVKEKLAMRAGETDKAVLRNHPELKAMGFHIGTTLGHIGNLDCDVFERDGKYYLLELNPRFGGGYPFSHKAGANYPAALYAWLKNEPYNFSQFTQEYDQPYSKFDNLAKVLF